ncbi:MAG: zinc-ribbon domain-containing protein [Saprospiraceae bacterium]|nr:zinc-ribbon domain-containing protein [Saprospiraceae bacterium]
MFCPKCGSQNSETAGFCASCGNPTKACRHRSGAFGARPASSPTPQYYSRRGKTGIHLGNAFLLPSLGHRRHRQCV